MFVLRFAYNKSQLKRVLYKIPFTEPRSAREYAPLSQYKPNTSSSECKKTRAPHEPETRSRRKQLQEKPRQSHLATSLTAPHTPPRANTTRGSAEQNRTPRAGFTFVTKWKAAEGKVIKEFTLSEQAAGSARRGAAPSSVFRGRWLWRDRAQRRERPRAPRSGRPRAPDPAHNRTARPGTASAKPAAPTRFPSLCLSEGSRFPNAFWHRQWKAAGRGRDQHRTQHVRAQRGMSPNTHKTKPTPTRRRGGPGTGPEGAPASPFFL